MWATYMFRDGFVRPLIIRYRGHLNAYMNFLYIRNGPYGFNHLPNFSHFFTVIVTNSVYSAYLSGENVFARFGYTAMLRFLSGELDTVVVKQIH